MKYNPAMMNLSLMPIWLQRSISFILVVLVALLVVAESVLLLGLARPTADWRLILEYLTVLRWPVIVVAILIVFRQNLANMIDRIISVKLPGGGSVDFNAQQQIVADATSSVQIDEGDLREFKDQVEKPVQTAPEIKNESKDDLLQKLNFAEIELEFERIFRIMFGTQLEVIKRLNSYRSGLNASQFEEVVNRHRMYSKNIGFQGFEDTGGFMQYPVGVGLVDYDPNTGIYRLSLKGEVFLKYLEMNQMTYKPL